MGAIGTGTDPGEHTIISNAACTTIFLAHILKAPVYPSLPIIGRRPGFRPLPTITGRGRGFDLSCHPLFSPQSPLCA